MNNMDVDTSEILYANNDIAVLHINKNKTAQQVKSYDVLNSAVSTVKSTGEGKEMTVKIPTSSKHHDAVHMAKSDVFMNIYNNARGLSDFTIRTPTKQFPIHKEVLMIHSEKYYNLFTSTDESNKEETPKDIELKNVSSEVIEKDIMKFLYTGKVQFIPNNVTDILRASTQMHLKNLKEACMQYLRNYTTENVLQLIPVCKDNLFKDLQREMTDFVYKNFPEIMLTEGFTRLDCQAVSRLLESYELRIHGETKILEAVMHWCNSHLDEIQTCAEQLLDSVHFYCTSPRDISNYLNMNGDILKISSCKAKIMDAYRYHAVQHHKNKTATLDIVDDNYKNEILEGRLILAIGGTSYSIDHKDSKSASSKLMAICLDSDTSTTINRWTEYGILPVPSSFHCVAIACGALYLIGGSDVNQCDFFKPEPSDRVFRFQPRDLQWIEVHPMLSKRVCFAATVVKDHIFVFGGLGTDQKVLNTCEQYSPYHDQWTSIETMVYGRAGLCAAGLSTDDILVVGGYTVNHYRKDLITYVECYSVAQNRWSQKKPRKSGIACASLVQANGHLYLIGGARLDDLTSDLVSTNNIETYMIQHDCWITIAALNISRMEMSTAVLGQFDTVYVDSANVHFIEYHS